MSNSGLLADAKKTISSRNATVANLESVEKEFLDNIVKKHTGRFNSEIAYCRSILANSGIENSLNQIKSLKDPDGAPIFDVEVLPIPNTSAIFKNHAKIDEKHGVVRQTNNTRPRSSLFHGVWPFMLNRPTSLVISVKNVSETDSKPNIQILLSYRKSSLLPKWSVIGEKNTTHHHSVSGVNRRLSSFLSETPNKRVQAAVLNIA